MLKWLARLAGRPVGPNAISLDLSGCWEVEAASDPSVFLRALPLVAGRETILYVEGTGERHGAIKLAELAVPAQATLAPGTIWSRPDIYHASAAAEVVNELATFLDDQPTGFAWSHCHLYERRAVLLQWHDAFSDPIYLAREIDAEQVAKFAEALGARWRPPNSNVTLQV